MNSSQFSPPVIIGAFKRPIALQKLLESIEAQTVHPPVIYVFIDGPNAIEDVEQIYQCRCVLTDFEKISAIKFVTYYRNENLGCAGNTVNSISEVLQTHDSMIFLDDDLVLAPGFYDTTVRMLDFYQRSDHIFAVSGFSSPIYSKVFRDKLADDFFVTNCFETWAWGTWRKKWDAMLPDIRNRRLRYNRIWQLPLYAHFKTIPFVEIWCDHHRGRIGNHRWSYLVVLNCLESGLLCVCPRVSLAENFGCGDAYSTNHTQCIASINEYFNSTSYLDKFPESATLHPSLAAPSRLSERFKYIYIPYARANFRRTRNVS